MHTPGFAPSRQAVTAWRQAGWGFRPPLNVEGRVYATSW